MCQNISVKTHLKDTNKGDDLYSGCTNTKGEKKKRLIRESNLQSNKPFRRSLGSRTNVRGGYTAKEGFTKMGVTRTK